MFSRLNCFSVLAIFNIFLQVKISLASANLRWVSSNDPEITRVNHPAISESGDSYYLARAPFLDGVMPGMGVVDHGLLNKMTFSFNGAIIEKPEFEVLLYSNSDLIWIKHGDGTDHSKYNMYAIGKMPEIGDSLYFCRVRVSSDFGKQLHSVGKLSKSLKNCEVPLNGEEVSFSDFEVLMTKTNLKGSKLAVSYKASSSYSGFSTDNRSLSIIFIIFGFAAIAITVALVWKLRTRFTPMDSDRGAHVPISKCDDTLDG